MITKYCMELNYTKDISKQVEKFKSKLLDIDSSDRYNSTLVYYLKRDRPKYLVYYHNSIKCFNYTGTGVFDRLVEIKYGTKPKHINKG